MCVELASFESSGYFTVTQTPGSQAELQRTLDTGAVHSAVVWCFVSIQAVEWIYTSTVLALFHSLNVLK